VSADKWYVFVERFAVCYSLAEYNKTAVSVCEKPCRRIKKETDISVSYVPSLENPADIASRGTTVPTLIGHNIWWNGPNWLSKPQSEWPQVESKLNVAEKEKYESEIKKVKRVETTIAQAIETSSNTNHNEQVIHTGEKPFNIDIERHSSLSKLLSVTALCLRFISRYLHSLLIFCRKKLAFNLCIARRSGTASRA